jgi:hypothetical protein
MIWYDTIRYDMKLYDMWHNMIWYDMLHLLTAVGLTPVGSSTVHIYTQTIHRATHLIQTIHRTTQLTNCKECGSWCRAPSLRDTKAYDKWKSHISSKHHVIYISSNNARHPVTKTFTTIHYTFRHFTSSHLNFTQLHFTTHSFGLIPIKPYPTNVENWASS